MVIHCVQFAHAWQSLLDTSQTVGGAGVVNISSRHPVGVAGLISPWNLPLYLLTFKIAPAIMTGNTVVCKPSEMTSVTAWMLCGLMREAGLPPGVVNMVFGFGRTVGESIVTHPKVIIDVMLRSPWHDHSLSRFGWSRSPGPP